MNKLSCEVIQDILPLYHDGVCSEQSRKLVDEHISSCATCKKMLNSLVEEELDGALRKETQEVLKKHAKKEKSIAMKTGIVIAGVLMLPIIIAVLLTLPGYSDWKTNAVLIASMLLVAGLTVVPLISKTKRFSKTVIFSTIALLLVIFFVEMFFDNGGILMFCEIAFSVVFGISVILFPFVIRQADLPETLSKQKALITMSWDTIWFYMMIFCFSIAYPYAIRDLVLVSSFFVALAWLIFVVARYIRTNKWIKSGIIVMLTGIWMSIGNYLGWVSVTLTDKSVDVHIIMLGISLLIGIGCVAVGTLRRRNKEC